MEPTPFAVKNNVHVNLDVTLVPFFILPTTWENCCFDCGFGEAEVIGPLSYSYSGLNEISRQI